MKKWSSFLVFLLISTQMVWADDISDVSQFAKKNIQSVIQLLRDKKIDKAVRNKKIIETVVPLFDFDLMAKLSLGKTYWQQFNEKQQKEFLALFVQRIQESYLEKLEFYTDEDVVYKDAKLVGDKVHVMTHLISKGETIEMLYKFYKVKASWKIYDLEIIGVSVIQTYRSQLDGLMKAGGVEGLLKQLRTVGGLKITEDPENIAPKPPIKKP